MGKRSPLAKSELEVVRIVWKLRQATVRQVLDALPSGRKLDFWTVQTYLRRLETKGYLRKRLAGRNNVYSSKVRPNTVIREVIDDIVARLFDGDALPMFQHLIDEDRGLADEEIEQLQQTLDQLKKGREK